MSLQTLKAKVKKFAKDLELDTYELENLEKITSTNDLIGGMTLLYRVLTRLKGESAHELIDELEPLNATLLLSELFELPQVRIRRSSRNPEVLVFSVDISSRKGKKETEITGNDISTIFKEAVEHHAAKWIEFLIDQKYVTNGLPSIKLPDAFRAGFWIRHFAQSAIEQEVTHLRRRQGLSENLLHGHGANHPTLQLNRETPYSPATFICPGYNISLFGNHTHSTGVILLPQKRVIDYWYSGLSGEELTREFDYKRGALAKYAKEDGHHFKAITESEIAAKYPTCIRTFLKQHQLDKYGIVEHSASLRWNEGLFRYQAQEVSGILVNPGSGKSISAAFELRGSLMARFGLTANQLPYYFYDLESKSLIQMSTLELEACLRRTQQHHSSVGSSRDTVFGVSASHSAPSQPLSNQTIFNS